MAGAGLPVVLFRHTAQTPTRMFPSENVHFFFVQVDKILKVIPRERRTFLFSATMTKKVDYRLLVITVRHCCRALRFFCLFTGPEAAESRSERSREVCSVNQILHSRQTAAVLHLHTIQVQGRGFTYVLCVCVIFVITVC